MRRVFRGWVIVLTLAWLVAAPAMAAPERAGEPACAWHQLLDAAAGWWAGLVAADSSTGTGGGADVTAPTESGESGTSNDPDHGQLIDPNG